MSEESVASPFWSVVSHDHGARLVARPLTLTTGFHAAQDTDDAASLTREPSVQLVVNRDGSLLVSVAGPGGPPSLLDEELAAAIDEGWRDLDAGRVQRLDLESLDRV